MIYFTFVLSVIIFVCMAIIMTAKNENAAEIACAVSDVSSILIAACAFFEGVSTIFGRL